MTEMLTRSVLPVRIAAMLTAAALIAAGCQGRDPAQADQTTSQTAQTPAERADNGAAPPDAQAGAVVPDANARPTADDAADECAAAQTQAELTACWTSAADRARTRAEAEYGRVRSWIAEREQPHVAESLQRAQVLWAQYRDTYCDAVAGVYEGGTVAAMQRAHCRASMDTDRANDLAALINDASPQ